MFHFIECKNYTYYLKSCFRTKVLCRRINAYSNNCADNMYEYNFCLTRFI